MAAVILAAITPFKVSASPPGADDVPDVPEVRQPVTPTVRLIETDSLGRWRPADYGGKGVCEVSDGVLSIGSGDPLTAVYWTGPFGTDADDALPRTDYRLEWQARRTLGSDFFTTLTFPVGPDHCSLVIGGWGGMATGLSTLNGMDAVENPTAGSMRFETDRWYRFSLAVRPDGISATVDGKPLFESVDPREVSVGIRIEMEPAKPLSFSSYLSSGEIRGATLTRLPQRKTPMPPSD